MIRTFGKTVLVTRQTNVKTVILSNFSRTLSNWFDKDVSFHKKKQTSTKNKKSKSFTNSWKNENKKKDPHVKTFLKVDSNLENEIEEHKVPDVFYEGFSRKNHEVPKLLVHLEDSEFVSNITEGETQNIFRLDNCKRLINRLNVLQFPLPETLEVKDWKEIIKYDGIKSMAMYLDAVISNEDISAEFLQELKTIDAETYAPLSVDGAILQKFFSEDPNLEEVWSKACMVYDKLQMKGEVLDPFPDEKQVRELLLHTYRNEIQQGKYFMYLAEIKKRKTKTFIQKIVSKHRGKELKEQRAKDFENSELEPYGLGGNTIFFRFYEKDFERLDFNRQYQNLNLGGNPIVIDVAYFDDMNNKSLKSLIFREFQSAIMHARQCPEPLNLHFTNYQAKNQKVDKLMHQSLPLVMKGETPEVVTDKCYTDLFPKENLVYLSPDSKQRLQYNPDDIYIIGGIVDTSIKSNMSLSHAKMKGIRHARLPMRETIGFDDCLNVDTVVAILLDFYRTKDWFYSFRWVPARAFKNKLAHQHGYTFQEEYTYLTHRKLFPDNFVSENGFMNPKLYRQKYSELLALTPKSKELQTSGKYHRNHQRVSDRKKSFKFDEI